MKKITFLFAFFLSLLGGTQAWAQEIADFEGSLPDGWEFGGSLSASHIQADRPYHGSYAILNSSDYGWDTRTNYYIKTEKLTGKVSFYMRAHSTSSGRTGYVVLYKLSDDGATLSDKLATFSSSSSIYANKEYTLEAPTRLAIVINGTDFDYMTYYPIYTMPWGISASDITATSATLSWNAVDDETSWEVQYSSTSDFSSDVNNVSASGTTTCNLTGLVDGTIYYVRVRVDSSSDWSKIFSFKASNEKELTLNNGTSATSYVPFSYSQLTNINSGFSQFIIQKTDISSLVNRRITKLTFYSSSSSVNFNGAEFDVYMKEYESQSTFANAAFNDWETLTKVYSGSLAISGSKMEITLEGDGFVYAGQNLLIGFKQTKAASSNPTSGFFLYTSTTNNVLVCNPWNATVYNTYKYLPQITFTTLPKVDVTGMSMAPASLTLAATETSQLTATISPANASNKSVTWTSNDESVATVDSEGIVTAIAAGTTTITATSVDNSAITATCVITVNAATRVTGLSLNKASTIVYVGRSEQLVPTISPDNATNKNVVWTSSDETIATVASDGTVSGVKAGTATITAKSDDNNEITATCTVTVQNVAVTGLTLNESIVSMIAEESIALVPSFEPADATIQTVTWQSSNTDVATVSESGVVTAVAVGTAIITATSIDNTIVKANCTINVVTAEEVTVNEGDATNEYIPVYGYYADNFQRVEFITPSSDILDIDGGTIKKLTFYSATESWDWGGAQFKVYIKEVANTTLSSFNFTEADQVYYTGSLSGVNSKMTITLDKPYVYNGGNLLVGIYETTKGTYKRIYFNGKAADSGVSGYANASNSFPAISATVTKQSFLPKTTFTYIPNNKPKMEVTPTSIDFGVITTSSTSEDKQKVITISNARGRATLSGISVNMKDGSDSEFSLSEGIVTSVEAGNETTFTVAFTPGAKENYAGTVVVSATEQTPIEIDLTATYRNNPASIAVKLNDAAIGATVAYGSLNKQTVKTFSITNDGDLPLTITSITSSNTSDFTIQNAPTIVAGGETETFDVTFVFDATPIYDVEKTSTITIKNSAGDDVTFEVTGTRIEVWTEDFDANVLPIGWEAGAKWAIKDGVAEGSYEYGTTNYLTTPKLLVAGTGEELTFSYKRSNARMVVQFNKDNGGWNNLVSLPSSGYATDTEWQTYTITGLEAGTYQFRFVNDDYKLDNFEGFKLVPVAAHAAEVKNLTIPAGNQYVEYTASVDVKVTGTNDEELTVKFFIGDDQYGSDVVKTVNANATETFEVTFTPDAAVSGDAYFTIESTDIAAFQSEKTAVTIAAATVIDENAANVFTEGTKPSVVLNYTKAAGKWGTITLPFQISVADLQTALGKDIKVYKYKSSTESSMTFDEATTLYAGYAHIIYSDEALDGARFFGVSFTATSANYDGSTVKFQATYEPIAAGGMTDKWGVTPNGEIMKGSDSATLKAMRGYLTASAEAHLSIFIEDTTTGITTVLSSKDFETENVYNLNGQKVNKAQKGLYIVNGRKVVKK